MVIVCHIIIIPYTIFLILNSYYYHYYYYYLINHLNSVHFTFIKYSKEKNFKNHFFPYYPITTFKYLDFYILTPVCKRFYPFYQSNLYQNRRI